MPGLEEKEEIAGTLGKAVRSLMLPGPPALLTWDNTANWTMQITCCPWAPGSSLVLLPIL